mgnify:CR=1 FL=1
MSVRFSEDVVRRVARRLQADPTLVEQARRIIEYYNEHKHEMIDGTVGALGTALEIGVDRGFLVGLVMDGALEAWESSRKVTFVVREETAKILEAAIELATKGAGEYEAGEAEAGAGGCGGGYQTLPSGLCAPSDLFDVIVGLDDVKEVLRRAISSPRPVHVLMVGPPATAKSLFLQELSRVMYRTPTGWERPDVIVMGGASRAGIRDYVAERQPQLLLIDEIDKVRDARDWSVLLSIMDPGILSITLHGRTVQKRVKIWVIAAANRADRLPYELLSRFFKVKIEEYTKEQLLEVTRRVLEMREGVDGAAAARIAELVVSHKLGIRDAVNLARMCGGDPSCVESVLSKHK